MDNGHNPCGQLFDELFVAASMLLFRINKYLPTFRAAPIPNKDLEEIFHRFYPRNSPTSSISFADIHRLAALFMVFEIGRLMDLSKDSDAIASDPELFHLLARAALAADSITEHPTVAGIQAMVSIRLRFTSPFYDLPLRRV